MSAKSSPIWLSLFAAQQDESRSLRERTCAAVRQAINSGQLAHGERLPSSRTLATDLKVSRVTVEAAYGQLEAEGYLTRRTGGGTYVAIRANVTDVVPPYVPKAATLSRRGKAIVASGGCFDPL